MVTRQIAALEAHLGCKLLERSTRRLRLTAAGTAYLEKCRVILNLVETAESDLAIQSRTPRGPIRMSMPLTFGIERISPLLLDFLARYQAVSIDMEFSDSRQNLIEEGFDLSIRITSQLTSGDIARKLGISRIKVVASPDYLARHGEPRTPAELSNHEVLGYTLATTGSLRFIVDDHVEHIPFRSRINANNGSVLVEAAAQGLGITCQPDFIADRAIAAGRVRQILAEHAMPQLGVYAMLPSNRQVPHRVRMLMDFLAEGLAGGPAGLS
jgi:DNA-binding transcriptional LysR family regulator